MHKSLLESPLVTLTNLDLSEVAQASPDVLLDIALALHATCLAQSNEIVSLTSQACTDPLTGLLNRRGLERCLTKMLARQERHGGAIYVLHIDLDDFKQINDNHNHNVGDLALTTISNRLTSQVRPDDIVARLGGDEFLVAVEIPNSPNSHTCCELIAQRILKAINEPFSIGRVRLQLSASIGGVEHLTREHTEASDLVNRADDAMYEIKRAGKAGFILQRNQLQPSEAV